MLNIPRILAGLILSSVIGGLAYRRGSLTAGGWLGAVITGTLTFGFGGWTFGLALIVFFITSSGLSHFREEQKNRIAGEKFEKSGRRDLAQALANGGIAGLLALIYGLAGQPPALLAFFAGVMATVTADTWATELGVLSPHPPRLITTLQVVPAGTSGGITGYGLLASALGGLLIGITLLLMQQFEQSAWLLWLLPAALAGGITGSLVDSLLGATLQAIYATSSGETERRYAKNGMANQLVRGWPLMNNDMVNLISSLAGGVAASGIFRLFAG